MQSFCLPVGAVRGDRQVLETQLGRHVHRCHDVMMRRFAVGAQNQRQIAAVTGRL